MLGRTGVKFSREAAQIARVFINDSAPIEVMDATFQLNDYDIEPLPPPSSQLYLQKVAKFTLKEYAQMANAKSGEFS